MQAYRVWGGHPVFEDPTVSLTDEEGREQLYARDGNRVLVHPDKRAALNAAIDEGLAFGEQPAPAA